MTDLNHWRLVDDYLAGQDTMTLATCGGDGPWAAAVFYAHEADLTLYFKSNPASRHMQDISKLADVAVTIHSDRQDWKTLRGLQILGRCSKVGDDEIARAERCYIEKFPFLTRISEKQRDAAERDLEDRLRATPFFKICPRWIRLIDNSRGFGHKTEIRLSG